MVDQVSYEFSLKMSRDYNSGGVTVGYKTDIKDGETKEEAMDRCVAFVESIVDKKLEDLREIYG